ncbi:MAG: CBS domain-containing protein [Thermoanaerobaculaceae bacterium]|jgi:CBS domain-containing protein/sporulation protein YlmC with PRC-barrel domain
MGAPPIQAPRVPDLPPGLGSFRFLYFSKLLRRPVCAGKIKDRIGRLSDLVFALKEPYPEAVGLYLEFGWGKPTQFVPWDRVVKIEDDAIFVKPPDSGEVYPPFVDQPGWMLVDAHLMGRTVLDTDGRRTEVVNDVHLLEAKGRLLLVHVDTSFNGILRRWGLGGLRLIKDEFISWKYVQPLSVEDAVATDKVSLSVTRKQMLELPSEDLADALEELQGEEQQALFSALDSEKAAETLLEAEPRAQRQLIADLRKERARMILSEMSIPQLANLFSVLPHDDVTELMELLSAEDAAKIRAVLSQREATAGALMSSEFVSVPPDMKVGPLLEQIRRSGRDPDTISYVYVVNSDGRTLVGIVDLRELVLAADDALVSEIMTFPVVSAEEGDLQDDLAELFAKYHYRMIPIVDAQDRMLGVIRYNEIMAGTTTRKE